MLSLGLILHADGMLHSCSLLRREEWTQPAGNKVLDELRDGGEQAQGVDAALELLHNRGKNYDLKQRADFGRVRLIRRVGLCNGHPEHAHDAPQEV